MKCVLFSIAIVCLFSGCSSENDPKPKAATKHNMENPETIGILPNGKTLKRFIVKRGSMEHDHFVYIVDNTITVNYNVAQGKSNRNETVVIIDGVEYSPVNK